MDVRSSFTSVLKRSFRKTFQAASTRRRVACGRSFSEQLEVRILPAPLGVNDSVGPDIGMSGWAFSPSASSVSMQINIGVDGVIASSGVANQPRPDVNAAFHITGQHGFKNLPLPSSAIDGRIHTVGLSGIDPMAGTRTLLATRSVQNHATQGRLDSISANGTLSGWAFDTDASNKSVAIHVYADGKFVVNTTANLSRPDVNSAYGITGSHGYSVTIPATLLDGKTHALTVFAIDTANPNGTLNTAIGTNNFTLQNKATVGHLDSVSASGTVSGWGYDPNSPSESVSIHLYADGALSTVIVANQSRPDVNQALAISGNHGFSFNLPAALLDGRSHQLTLYAIDLTTVSGNSNIGTQSFAYGNATIRGSAIGGTIEIGTTARLAGAIGSLTYNGKQFINSADHGRELQSAITTDGGIGGANKREGFNPTEAGSEADGAGSTSTSRLRSISASGNQLSSSAQMAFWNTPGTAGTVNQTALSNFTLRKDVTIGAFGLPNVIRYQTTFNVPSSSNTRLAQFEILTGYMPGEFSRFMTYDANTRSVQPVGVNNFSPEQPMPLVFSTADGNFAMAIVTERSGAIGANSPVNYGRWNFTQPNGYGATFDLVKWNSVFRLSNQTVAGDYTFTSFVVVGDLATVTNSLGALQNQTTFAHGAVTSAVAFPSANAAATQSLISSGAARRHSLFDWLLGFE